MDLHLSKDMLAYVSYNRGVKGGGFNAPLFPIFINDLSTLSFKPETLTSYEVGFKSEFLDHTVRFNAAAYYYDYKDYQALIYTLGLEQLIVNADATHKGAEAELDWAPSAAWRFGAGVAYVDAVVNGVAARCCGDPGTPYAGVAIPGNYTPGNAPRWTGNAMARYTDAGRRGASRHCRSTATICRTSSSTSPTSRRSNSRASASPTPASTTRRKATSSKWAHRSKTSPTSTTG